MLTEVRSGWVALGPGEEQVMADSHTVRVKLQRARRDGESVLSCEDWGVSESLCAEGLQLVRRGRERRRVQSGSRSQVACPTSLPSVLVWMAMGLALCTRATPAAEPAPRSLQALPTAAAPVIDGVLDEACWRGAAGFEGFLSKGEPVVPHPEQLAGWICYDEQHLYVGVRCQVNDVAAAADQEMLRNAGKAGLQLLDKLCTAAPAVVSEAMVAEQDKPSLATIGADRRRVIAAIVRIQKAAGLVADEFAVRNRSQFCDSSRCYDRPILPCCHRRPSFVQGQRIQITHAFSRASCSC
ncbi:MAG: hypothetical protein VX346_22955 [Planctomycetota bacterium]|nr:hypothetical protein [Planctomycetota bacterium]